MIDRTGILAGHSPARSTSPRSARLADRYARLSLSRPISLVDRLARDALLHALRRWRHGHVTLHLPEGRVVRLGDARAAERVQAFVFDDAFFTRVLVGGEIGAGEAYSDGLWRADDLPLLLRLFIRNLDELTFDTPLARVGQLANLVRHKLRKNSRAGSAENIHAHYDLGNDFYRLFLDETMAYSCALYRRGDETLEEAQRNKYELVCDKLRLSPEDHLLEIGGGWGGFAIHAARTRGCRVTTVTISRAQLELGRARVRAAGLAERVSVEEHDYRALSGRFDKIASIEMFEAVGYEYFGEFFATCSRLLARDGIMLLQTISMPDQRFDTYRKNVDWHQKHIFPGCCIPSLSAITRALARSSDLTVHHLEDIGPSYARTLAAWRARFHARLDDVRALGFDARFVRTWEMYLGFSEASFAERTLGDLQIVLTKPRNRTLPELG
jgi:cyclopropane-fatty-acyl-phospholipid synthase